MTKKFFDIIPPTIRKLAQPLPPVNYKNRNNLNSLLYILILVLLMAILFFIYEIQNKAQKDINSQNQTTQK